MMDLVLYVHSFSLIEMMFSCVFKKKNNWMDFNLTDYVWLPANVATHS